MIVEGIKRDYYKMDNKIPFNKPWIAGNEIENILNVINSKSLSGDGFFTKRCSEYLREELKTKAALITHSCTAALEMTALLTEIKSGDEVILPSYTFVSTANAFVLRGAIPVFVDIDADTLNIDPSKIESSLTSKTKVIIPVHYAGVSCDMDKIMNIARKNKLFVIEDSAQGYGSKYKNQNLGTIGDLGALSFHETKNLISGEGGALLINKNKYIDRAEIIREKGTHREKFTRGKVDKYTWQSLGSSYLPSELVTSFYLGN